MTLLMAQYAAADSPTGSITIYGPNGTEITGTRNVLLNLSYNSTDVVEKCRWGNDNTTNLNLSVWEECTTVKAWILSEGEGNKTVYFSIRDRNSNISTFNDSIIYRFVQDYTGPTAPTVYDGLYDGITRDIDWWNSNTTLSANWLNATEDISIVNYKYRILANGSCYNNDCNWTDANTTTKITVTGLTLLEGTNYSFEVMAYNPFGFNSTRISNGTTIDITKPNPPTINSTTHPVQSQPYDQMTAMFNWTATDPNSSSVSSGILGYSYLLDRHPGTMPDSNAESRYWETLAEMRRGSNNQTLKANGSGAANYAYAVFRQIRANFTANDSVKVRVALAERNSDYDSLMNVKVFLIKVNEDGTITAFSQDSNAISNIANVSMDIRYAEDMSDATIYVFNLTINETVNDATKDIYVVVSGLADDDDNNNSLDIAATNSSYLIDNTTARYMCDETNTCSNVTVSIDYAIDVKKEDSGTSWKTQYNYLGDDTYYFHVRAKDRAGNWGDTQHYTIIVAAGGVSSIIYSPTDGSVFTATGSTINISVSVAVSGNTSAQVVAEHPDGSSYTSTASVFNRVHTFENITLEQGTNTIYAVTNTSSGAVSRSSRISIIVSGTLQPAMNKTLTIKYTGCTASSLPYLCNRDETTVYAGIATESGVIAAPSVQANTTENSLKIYLTQPFNLAKTASELYQNIFLDQISPTFGYTNKIGKMTVRNELRYSNKYLGGNFRIPAGIYHLEIRKNGVTTDGRTNITILLSET
jgi:hypothetical protein